MFLFIICFRISANKYFDVNTCNGKRCNIDNEDADNSDTSAVQRFITVFYRQWKNHVEHPTVEIFTFPFAYN